MNDGRTRRFRGLTLVAVVCMFCAPVVATAQGVLFVVDDSVGIGTQTPGAPLEINPPSGNAAFRLNFGGQSTWAISNTSQVVTFNKIGSGGQETTFRERLDGSGLPTFDVQGSVRGTQFLNSSSRELKTNFSPVDGRDVLEKLIAVPVDSWSYKSDPLAKRHYGPVAEDFQAAFDLGDGKTISTIDASGVALAAIQALHGMVLQRDAELETLRAEVEALRTQIEAP